MNDDRRARWTRNAFYVLGLSPEAPRAEVERAAQKLLALLGVGAAAAKTYDTPFGPMARTEDLVRAAAATLRDPDARVTEELWARAPTGAVSSPPVWADARGALGLRRRRA